MAEVAQVWQNHILAAKAKLLSMPAKLGPQLVNNTDAASIAARIREEIYAALIELAESSDVEANGMDGEGEQDMDAAPESDGVGLG